MFFEIVQVALGVRERLSRNPSDSEWSELFDLAQKHAIAAFLFETFEQLSKHGQRPPMEVLMEWLALSEETAGLNRMVNRTVVKLIDSLNTDGFRCSILKGQGNAWMYPNPLNRQPGDIDVWMMCHTDTTDIICPTDIIRYVKTKNPQACAMYHHIDYGQMDGVEVEAHYRPSFMYNPWHNRRLQRWFVEHAEEQFQNEVELPDGVGTINVPTAEFNVIFQLSHVYNHLLHEGVGLRQIIDYYYLLKTTNFTRSTSGRLLLKGRKNFTNSERRTENIEIEDVLRYLGLDTFAGAMMWVLHDVLGLSEEYLIAPRDERRGRVLLTEIMRGGNFGMYDSDNVNADSWLKKNLQRFKRDLRLIRYFPSECLCEPFFRIYHFFWRMRYN